MDRVRIMTNELNNYKQEGRLNAAYYKSIEGFFETVNAIVVGYFFANPRFVNLQMSKKHWGREGAKLERLCPAEETVAKMYQIAEKFVQRAESVLGSVVEIDSKLAEALEAEVLLVTGNKAKIQPKILSPSLMFRGTEEPKSNDQVSRTKGTFEPDKLFPQIPFSKLALDFCGVQYNALLVLKRAEELRQSSAKSKSNAIYLSGLKSILRDLRTLSRQRDAIDHLLHQSQEELCLLNLDPVVLAEQLSHIDSMLFSHMNVIEELQLAGWIGRERRLRAPYLTAMREFGGYISHWVTWEVLKPELLSYQQRAEAVVHFVGVAECLSELASYNQLAAVIRGLSSPAILRLGPLFDLLPKRTLMAWDTLQQSVIEPIKQRALLQKPPSTCIPAFDTAYLLDLLAFEPDLLTLKGKPASSIAQAAQKKFSKYVEAMEKFRLQSLRSYTLKQSPLNPAVQNFLLSRPFLSRKELMGMSLAILSPHDTENVLKPEACLIKQFYRRYLDDEDRLFMPLANKNEHSTDNSATIKITTEDDSKFSLGEMPETMQTSSFYPLNDVDERAARINNIV